MLLAQAESVGKVVDAATKSAADNGLIGILLVLVLLAIGLFIWRAFAVGVAMLKDAVASTVDLHTSIKETNLKLTVTLDKVTDDHGDKLSDIRTAVAGIPTCPYSPPKPANPPPPPNMTPAAFGV